MTDGDHLINPNDLNRWVLNLHYHVGRFSFSSRYYINIQKIEYAHNGGYQIADIVTKILLPRLSLVRSIEHSFEAVNSRAPTKQELEGVLSDLSQALLLQENFETRVTQQFTEVPATDVIYIDEINSKEHANAILDSLTSLKTDQRHQL